LGYTWIFAILVFCEEYGLASWYGGGEPLNYFTASGEIFSPFRFTCAHRTLPFGTLLRITNLSNNKSVIVRVNDRGPADWLPSRVVDLTRLAFEQIEDLDKGLTFVKVEVLNNIESQTATIPQAQLTYEFTQEIRDIVRSEIKDMFREVKNEMKLVKNTKGINYE
jgi:rare lipoprotein A